MPSRLAEVSYDFLITIDIVIELLLPEGSARLRCIGEPATLVPVPEATMNEDDSLVLRQDQVG